MPALVCGSLAFDSIANFGGRFADQILPNQLHVLNVSFLVPTLRREFGGCAGNIAYNLAALGGEPVVVAAVGADGSDYLARLRSWGTTTDHVHSVAEAYTEWFVFREGSGFSKEWEFDRHTADVGGVGVPLPDFQPLPDSAVSVETFAANAPTVAYGAWEEDPAFNEFFDRQFVDFNPLLGSRTVLLTYPEKFGDDCRIQMRMPIDIHLLTPGYSGGPVASQ